MAGECGDGVESRLWHVEMIDAECEVVFFDNAVAVKRVERVLERRLVGGSVAVSRLERGGG